MNQATVFLLGFWMTFQSWMIVSCFTAFENIWKFFYVFENHAVHCDLLWIEAFLSAISISAAVPIKSDRICHSFSSAAGFFGLQEMERFFFHTSLTEGITFITTQFISAILLLFYLMHSFSHKMKIAFFLVVLTLHYQIFCCTIYS